MASDASIDTKGLRVSVQANGLIRRADTGFLIAKLCDDVAYKDLPDESSTRDEIDRLKAELERANDKPIAMLKAVAGGAGRCDMCGRTATCLGAYESEENLGFACDECCGHGNEDGWCVRLKLKADLTECDQSFDLRWEADMRARDMWHAAGGDEMTWPDHADLCVWLLERLAEARETVERQGKLMEPAQYPGPIARALRMVNKERQRGVEAERQRIVEILRGLKIHDDATYYVPLNDAIAAIEKATP